MNAIGKNIKKIRKDRRLTQKQLAERCNLAEITIRQYEAEKYIPKIGNLQRIANALEVSVFEIYGGESVMKRDYLEWIDRTYRLLIDNKEIPKMEMKLADGGKISVYRVGDVIRVDIKRPETKR